MSNRKAASVLSFICPGLGQLYRHEVLKGMSFIMICALLILSLFFLSPPLPLLYYLGISILLLIWLVNIVDAYVDDAFLMERAKRLTWQRTLALLPVGVIFAAMIILIALWANDFSETNRRLVAGASLRTIQNARPPADDQNVTESSVENDKTGTFSIQVASFRELWRAKEVYHDLLDKEYTVNIEQVVSADEVWHRILVGKFSHEEGAMSFMKTLYERERFSNMVVRQRTASKEQ